MKPWHRKTDTERVESTRRLTSKSKWFGIFHVCGFLLFVATFFLAWNLTFSLKEDMFPDMTESISQGVHIGMMLGAFAGLQLMLALICLGWALDAFSGYPIAKLMLKYHDRLKEVEKDS